MSGSFSNVVQPGMDLTNSLGTWVADRFGRPAQALDWQGPAFVGSPSADFLKGGSNWTFSVWIQPESQALAGLAALYTEGVPQLTFSIYLASGAVQVFSYNQAAVPPAAASATLGSGPVVVPNIWQHIAITFAATNEFAGTCSIYVGGTNVATGSMLVERLTAPDIASFHSFMLGENVGHQFLPEQSSLPFLGAMDDLRLFQRTFEASEIPDLRDADIPPPPLYSVTAAYAGPLAGPASNAPVGTISITPTNSAVAGTQVTLTATAEPGYGWIGWSGDVLSQANPLVLTLSSNVSLIGKFGVVAVAGAAHAEVHVSPALSIYPLHTEVTLTVLPDQGYEFVS